MNLNISTAYPNEANYNSQKQIPHKTPYLKLIARLFKKCINDEKFKKSNSKSNNKNVQRNKRNDVGYISENLNHFLGHFNFPTIVNSMVKMLAELKAITAKRKLILIFIHSSLYSLANSKREIFKSFLVTNSSNSDLVIRNTTVASFGMISSVLSVVLTWLIFTPISHVFDSIMVGLLKSRSFLNPMKCIYKDSYGLR